MPGLGRPRPYLRRGARAFPVSPWQIIYTPLAGLDGIRVIRVVDARRDLPTLLGKKRKRQS
jgi:plasmid stabilization system protein ParE